MDYRDTAGYTERRLDPLDERNILTEAQIAWIERGFGGRDPRFDDVEMSQAELDEKDELIRIYNDFYSRKRFARQSTYR